MIEGLKLDVPGSVLQDHARARAEHHEARAAAYESERDAARERETEVDAEAEAQNVTRQAKLSEQFESDRRRHLRRAQYFTAVVKFISEHETYRFTPDEIVELEFVEATRW